MKIYMVRHGQTAWNKAGRWQGNKDIPLDETGIEQTKKLAFKLSSYCISKIYASPLKRAAMSAEILNSKISADVVCRHGLREVSLGEWEGFTTDEIIERHGGLFKVWEDKPAAVIGLGVENMVELQERALQEFQEIVSQETDDFLIVAHGTWLKCLLCKLLNIPLESRVNFEISNTGINVVDCNANGDFPHYTVITLNDVSHIT